MTRSPARAVRDALERYGPTVALVVALGVLTAAIPTDQATGRRVAPESTDEVHASDGSAAPSATPGGPGGPAASGARDGQPGGETAGGAPSDTGASGEDCRADGRMRGISHYMPPCVPLFTGDNGGATARGVDADSVTVAIWSPQSDPVTSSLVAAAGVADRPEDVRRGFDVLVEYFNQHYETYGRKIEVVYVTASGATTDDQAMRADVVHIAKDIGAFAVIALGEPQSFDEEAVEQGLICIPCGLSPPQAFYDRSRGYAFGGYPPNEVYYRHMAEYIGKRLAGGDAQWAGDEDMRTEPRKFGLIWIENNPSAPNSPPDPDRKAGVELYKRELARYGVELAADVSYVFDLSRVQEQATNVIAQMKVAGVSNLAIVGDPASPIFFTKEATRQQYFPEWFITGNFVTDNVVLGRLYDQSQWQHAFGIGFLFTLPAHFDQSVGYLEYKTTDPGGEVPSSIATLRQPVETLFTGIHMAGPELTTASFARGMYAYPPSGGVFSSWLTFFTPEDPTSVKDFKELWWSATEQGEDEYGNAGTGMIMNADGGRRYRLGEWPSTPPRAFDPEGAITSADDPYFRAQYDDEQQRPVADRPCRSCA